MVEAIIFDMDGVLADTDKGRFQVLRVLLKEQSVDLQDGDIKKLIGRRTKDFLREVCGDKLSAEQIEQIFQQRKQEYHRHPERYIVCQPYAAECCKAIHSAVYTMAIASASEKKDIELVLTQINASDYFKVIVSVDMVKQSKPSPEVYQKCIAQLGISPLLCVAIEDSPVGVQAAKAAGLYCIAVTYTHTREELMGADMVVDSLDKITSRLLKSISAK